MSKIIWYDFSDIANINTNINVKKPNYLSGEFSERNRFNIPGPFYGAMTDTCLTGPLEALLNVMVDGAGQEFVFRQPSDLNQLECVLCAAYIETFAGYGADGDDHWTLELIREWWMSRHDLLAEAELLRQCNENVDEWKQYLLGPAIDYLRQYAFFIEEGQHPFASDPLPIL